MKSTLKAITHELLSTRYAEAYSSFKNETEELTPNEILAMCDVIYSLYLSDNFDKVNSAMSDSTVRLYRSVCLYGEKENSLHQTLLSPHLSAYLLGSLRLLQTKYSLSLPAKQWILNEKLSNNLIPKYPLKYKLHPWRVSHWLGGVLSIVYNLNLIHDEDIDKQNLFQRMIDSYEHNIINKNGLIDLGAAAPIQSLFDVLYKIRHNPEHGKIGGIVHITWIYHAIDRKYKGLDRLISYAEKLILEADGFMEDVPYCLDFDFLQLLRTGYSQLGISSSKDELFLDWRRRLEIYMSTEAESDSRFSLHKLPGALASIRECELHLSKSDNGMHDIIKAAGWL
ncbi:hypothetical protein PN836_020390 [Ningiella sp. W23]|uniref:hypothetical protein n=1 Tax=Ningiella sp. W23 TaxID=3023715 RepID=UPI0037564AA7